MQEAKKYEKICIVFIILSCVRTLHTINVQMSAKGGEVYEIGKWGELNTTQCSLAVFVCRLESQQEHVMSVAEGKNFHMANDECEGVEWG